MLCQVISFRCGFWKAIGFPSSHGLAFEIRRERAISRPKHGRTRPFWSKIRRACWGHYHMLARAAITRTCNGRLGLAAIELAHHITQRSSLEELSRRTKIMIPPLEKMIAFDFIRTNLIPNHPVLMKLSQPHVFPSNGKPCALAIKIWRQV